MEWGSGFTNKLSTNLAGALDHPNGGQDNGSGSCTKFYTKLNFGGASLKFFILAYACDNLVAVLIVCFVCTFGPGNSNAER